MNYCQSDFCPGCNTRFGCVCEDEERIADERDGAFELENEAIQAMVSGEAAAEDGFGIDENPHEDILMRSMWTQGWKSVNNHHAEDAK